MSKRGPSRARLDAVHAQMNAAEALLAVLLNKAFPVGTPVMVIESGRRMPGKITSKTCSDRLILRADNGKQQVHHKFYKDVFRLDEL